MTHTAIITTDKNFEIEPRGDSDSDFYVSTDFFGPEDMSERRRDPSSNYGLSNGPKNKKIALENNN